MSWLLVFDIFEWLLRLGMVPVLLRRRLSTATTTAWLAVIFFLPWFGVIIYMMFGDVRLGRGRAKKHRAMMRLAQAAHHLTPHQRELLRPVVDAALAPVASQADKVGGNGLIGGNHIELLPVPNDFIDRLIADIDAAKTHVHLLFYIYEDDATGKKVAEALARACQRGVTVRLLADAAGSWNLFRRAGLATALETVGVQVHACLPVTFLRRGLKRIDLRNHRKLVIIDGSIAYTGSQNIVNPDYGHKQIGHWVDLMARFTGPIVAQLQLVFLDDWLFETGQSIREAHLFPELTSTGQTLAQTVPTGPGISAESLPRVLVAAINLAKQRIVITTPYLVPDEPMLLALSLAVDRGVEVSLVVPVRGDHQLVKYAGRAYYQPLLEAGVKIFVHEQGLLHSKTMTVDDSFALLGSANLDIRSFYLNLELNVLLYGPQITQQMFDVQSKYISESKQLELKNWNSRSTMHRYLENAAALLSPIL